MQLVSADSGWFTKIDATGFEEAAEQVSAMGQVRYVQLEPGQARVQGAIARLGRVIVGRFAGDRNRMVTLDTPPGRLMLFVATRGVARLGAADINPGDVVIANRATQLVAFGDRAFLPVSISLDAGDLQQVSADLGLELQPSLQDVSILRAPGPQAAALDQLVQGIVQVADIESNALQSVGVMTQLDDTVLQWCAALLHKERVQVSTLESPVTRRRAALRAREFIDAHLDEPLSLTRVCRASYACARALEYGFREMFELSPMAYVRFARLSRVRRDLYYAKKCRRTVTRLATRWGFGHLGQFSRDYCALFGELPSETLARSMVCKSASDSGDEEIEPVLRARLPEPLVSHARN